MKRFAFACLFLGLVIGQLEFSFSQDSDRRARMERRRQIQKRAGGNEMRRPNNRRDRNTNTGVKVGDVAPGFKLKSLDGKSETDLSTFKGVKPVVLLFGSYT